MTTVKIQREVQKVKDIERMILQARLSRKEGAMFEFAKLLWMMKNEKLYQSLGFETFRDWFYTWGFPRQTIYSWLNIHATFVVNLDFTKQELQQFEVRILKALLPVARSGAITKEKLAKVMINARSKEFGKFLELLPEIKRSFGLKKKS